MKFNICTVNPAGYEHSRAFDELAILVKFGLVDLGFQAEVNSNKIDADAKNIIIGSHLLDPSSEDIIPSDTIILNTEQLSAEIGTWHANILHWLRKYEAWDYSERNIESIVSAGLPRPRHLILGYHPYLETIPKLEQLDIDILFYGSISDRRRKILQELVNRGLTVKFLYGVYGKDRDHWISRSKVILNIHMFEAQIFEIVRCFYLMTNQKAIVAEVNNHTSISENYKSGISGVNYDALVDTCVEICRNDEARKKLEINALEAIRKIPQASVMKSLL